ncbi:mannan-binding lectin serine protease 2-like [Styela clava]
MRISICFAIFCLLVFDSNTAVQILRGRTYGQFKSSNYPLPYENHSEKEWRIIVREGFKIRLRFTTFNLKELQNDGERDCTYNFFEITERNNNVGRFCGNLLLQTMKAPKPSQWFHTVGNTVNVKSNDGISPTGFHAHYVEEDIDECDTLQKKKFNNLERSDKLTCDHFCNNVPGSYYCSCRTGFFLHKNNHTCIATFCENQVLTADEGVIESPEYPQPYAKLSNCTWDIRVQDGLSVRIKFDTRFEIEEHIEQGCTNDILILTYNDREDSYCGTTAPDQGAAKDMNTNNVRIKFTSDISEGKMGFKFTYDTSRIRCLKTLGVPSNGQILRDFSKGYHEFEDVVDFICNRGYDLIGEKKLQCHSNGTWNHEQPVCRIK